jgi:hypothetical protein
LAFGCGCVTTISERYRVETENPIGGAGLVAVERLGWTAEKLDDARFRLLDYGPLGKGPIDVTVSEDRSLLLTGPANSRDENGKLSMGGVGPLLTQAVRQTVDVSQMGPPVPRRSLVLTTGFDLVLPAAGALYALPGNPYSQLHWGLLLALRVGLDVVGALNVAQGLRFADRFEVYAGAMYIVLNRVLALMFDLPAADYFNKAAQSGLSLDLSRPVQRLPP